MRQQIEQLALRCVVAEPDGSLEWLPALEKIRDQAAREQAGRVVPGKRAGARNVPPSRKAKCAVFSMPREAIELGAAEQVRPLLSVSPAAILAARVLLRIA